MPLTCSYCNGQLELSRTMQASTAMQQTNAVLVDQPSQLPFLPLRMCTKGSAADVINLVLGLSAQES